MFDLDYCPFESHVLEFIQVLLLQWVDAANTSNALHLRTLQLQACQELKEYIADRDEADSGSRLIHLLLLLPTLRSFNKQILVELFFSGLIGNVQVENVIPFILKMDVLQIFGQTATSLASIL